MKLLFCQQCQQCFIVSLFFSLEISRQAVLLPRRKGLCKDLVLAGKQLGPVSIVAVTGNLNLKMLKTFSIC